MTIHPSIFFFANIGPIAYLISKQISFEHNIYYFIFPFILLLYVLKYDIISFLDRVGDNKILVVFSGILILLYLKLFFDYPYGSFESGYSAKTIINLMLSTFLVIISIKDFRSLDSALFYSSIAGLTVLAVLLPFGINENVASLCRGEGSFQGFQTLYSSRNILPTFIFISCVYVLTSSWINSYFVSILFNLILFYLMILSGNKLLTILFLLISIFFFFYKYGMIKSLLSVLFLVISLYSLTAATVCDMSTHFLELKTSAHTSIKSRLMLFSSAYTASESSAHITSESSAHITSEDPMANISKSETAYGQSFFGKNLAIHERELAISRSGTHNLFLDLYITFSTLGLIYSALICMMVIIFVFRLFKSSLDPRLKLRFLSFIMTFLYLSLFSSSIPGIIFLLISIMIIVRSSSDPLFFSEKVSAHRPRESSALS